MIHFDHMTPALRLDRSPLADLLAYRRAIVAAAAAKRRPPKLSRPRHPTAIAVAFESWLVALSRSLDREILRALASEGIVRRDEEIPEIPEMTGRDIQRLTAAVERRLRKVVSRGSLTGKLDQLAARTERYTREQWRAQLHAAIGIDPLVYPDVSDLIDTFREQNVRRIVSLSQEKIDRVRDVLREAGPSARVEVVTDRIHNELDVTESRARLIARTEASTLSARMTQAQHEAAGITRYIWSTANDERVRPSHAELDGREFAYGSPPAIEGEGRHGPGEFPNCRCVGTALLPGIDYEE